MINRIFVEKKPGFDVQARRLAREWKEQLGAEGIEQVRVVNRYDVLLEGAKDFDAFVYGVFAEVNQDIVHQGELPRDEGDFVFAVKYQPGQYDVRCDSAQQCVRLMDSGAKVQVKHATVYVIKGEVPSEVREKIVSYMVNPVDSQLAQLEEAPDFAEKEQSPSVRVVLEGFTDRTDEELAELIEEKSLAMDLADCRAIRDYFKLEEKRDPTETELKVIDTYWSDHCRHTTFSTILTSIRFGEGKMNEAVKADYQAYLDAKKELGRGDKPTTLMDLATMGARLNKARGLGDDIEESDEINACSYHIKADIDGKEEDYLLMFKNETHNHPTEIEPFGGAATCLGGAIRDPLSGRSYVYQSMRVSGAADPTVPIAQTIKGKLPQRKITTQAASGFSSYGNQIGLCTGQVREYYHPDFVAKRMEVGAVIAAAPKENVVRKKPRPGDLVYVVGGRTGRDGIGGASGSSKEHNEKSVDTAGSEVQKGNAPEERKLQRLFRNPSCAKLIKKCNDFGAGGVSVAIGELADSLDINLDTLLLKYDGLNATELAISESQERMAVVIEAKDEEAFLSCVKAENLEYSKTAVVTDTGRLVMTFCGQEVLNLKRSFIDTNGAAKYASVTVDFSDDGRELRLKRDNFADNLIELAKDLNVCSQKGLVEMFDNTIGAGTVLMPFGGKYMRTPSDVMVSKLPAEGDVRTVSVMAHGYDPYLGKRNPYLSGVYATVSCLSKMVCAGVPLESIKLSCQEYFEKLKDDPARWGKVFGALLGALRVQTALGVSAIGGKDSMSGTYENISVPPSIIVFGAAACGIGRVTDNVCKKSGSYLFRLTSKKDETGLINLSDYRKNMQALSDLIGEGKVKAAMATGYGGTADAVMKMCVGNGLGFAFEDGLNMRELFETDYCSVLLEVDDPGDVKTLSGRVTLVGRTTNEGTISYQNEKLNLMDLIHQWEAPLSQVFPAVAEGAKEAEAVSYSKGQPKKACFKIAKPRVFVPVFPGTNCEYDTLRAFERAGAQGSFLVFKNKTEQDVEESVREMARLIREAQIVAFPGGFSAGDEPDGSGKFIVSALRNPYVTEALMELLQKRDGLILGICNGFQALIKTGLLPYGEIRPLAQDSPTLTYNTIGRHVAKVAYTRVSSNLSPWLAGVNVGDVHGVALSHGEGRFVAKEEDVKRFMEKGQIATQYCDIDGNVLADGSVNPNGSVYNIEGLTSVDGRILGKMGHSERTGFGLYQNIEGDFDQRIFESGVAYFS